MMDIGAFSARGINNRGQIVGSYIGEIGTFSHGVLWEDGIMTELPTLGGRGSVALDINDRGQVVGVSWTADDGPHAFLWERGVMIDLGTLGGSRSTAFAINDRGQVVGDGRTEIPGETHAFLWEDGVMTDLGTLGAEDSWGRGVNNRGEVVGYARMFVGEDDPERAVRWRP